LVEEAPPLLPDEWAPGSALTSEEAPAAAAFPGEPGEAEASIDPALAEAPSEPAALEPEPAAAPPRPQPVAVPPAPEPAPVVARPEPARAPAPAPAQRRAAPAAPPILVNVSAIPSALIHVDGGVVGETPLAGLPLSPGLHVFRAEFPGGRAVVRTVEVSSENRHVNFE
jgi:hypothetical protein